MCWERPHESLLLQRGSRGKGAAAPFPCTPNPRPNRPPLRSGQFRLTIPNTYSTITMPASLRSDCCSPSLRNAVRLPSGIDVHLHRNTHNASTISKRVATEVILSKFCRAIRPFSYPWTSILNEPLHTLDLQRLPWQSASGGSKLHARSGPWGEIPFLLLLSRVIPVGAARLGISLVVRALTRT